MKFVAAVLVLLASANAANGADAWLTVTGGYSNYGLGSITDATFSDLGFSFKLEPGSLDSGPSFGAAVGVDFVRPWALGLAYEHLSASSGGVGGDVTAEADLPVHIFMVVPRWYPYTNNSFKVGVGAGVGIGFLSGFASSARGFIDPFHGEVSESSMLVEGHLEVEYAPFEGFWFVASIGLRHITFDEVTVGFVPLRSEDTVNGVPFDYGGGFFRVGLKWEFPKGGSGA